MVRNMKQRGRKTGSGRKPATQSLCGTVARSLRVDQKLTDNQSGDEENENWETKGDTKPPRYVCTGCRTKKRPQASSPREKARASVQQFDRCQKERHQAGKVDRRSRTKGHL
jgi:hypothetical protein